MEIIVEALDFTFVKTASLQFLFPKRQNSKFMHSDTSIVRYSIFKGRNDDTGDPQSVHKIFLGSYCVDYHCL